MKVAATPTTLGVTARTATVPATRPAGPPGRSSKCGTIHSRAMNTLRKMSEKLFAT